MLKIVLSVTALSIMAPVFSAPGDTTRIHSHQQTHWNWAGSWFDTVQFPQTGSYRRILMNYTLGCPSIGCSEWDYTTHIEVRDVVNDTSVRWLELARIITPYAGNKNFGWTHTWVIDVTDYAPVLQGERVIAARYSGYQDGFTVTISFDFIEGDPTREVVAINQLYHGTHRYGFANDPIENKLVPRDIAIHQDCGSAKFRMVASGHSFGGNENCAEFCKKYYQLKINNLNTVQRHVWRDDCGNNALEAQTGTWIYNRAGWCPGDVTTRYDDEVMHRLTAGQTATLDVDWEGYVYTGGAGFDPQYYIESLLFQYKPWRNSRDAAINDVIRPSVRNEYMHLNPVCNNPIVVISNQGSEPITRLEIEYWTEGTPEHLTHKWQGLVLSGGVAEIELPSQDWKLFGGKTDNVFHAEIMGVNNSTDQNSQNNHYKSRFEEVAIFPESFIIAFNNNNAANETSYRIINDSGTVVFSRGGASAGIVLQDTVSLTKGCYRFLVEDSDCDGLQFFANSDGNGRIWIHPNDQANFFPPLHRFEPQFGCHTELNFTVGYTMSVEPKFSDKIEVFAYPNPASASVWIAVSSADRTGNIEIIGSAGQVVLSVPLNSRSAVEISGLSSGVYTALYSSSTGSSMVRFIIAQ